MIYLSTTSPLSLSSNFLPPPSLPQLSLTHTNLPKLNKKRVDKLRRNLGICKAEFHQDAPFAAAIGACILSSYLFPTTGGGGGGDSSDDEDAAAMTSADARIFVMTIISFIPYFNWLSWVFAAMDTGKRRYAVYALVYLAPYLKTNLSLEESWLPITSIVLCVVHIQLEASIYSGDLDGFNFFREVSKRLGLYKKHNHAENLEEMENKEKSHRRMKLSLRKEAREDIIKWGLPRKPSQDVEQVDKDAENDENQW